MPRVHPALRPRRRHCRARFRPRRAARCRRDAGRVLDRGGAGTEPAGAHCPGSARSGPGTCTDSAMDLASESRRSYRPLPMQLTFVRCPAGRTSARWSLALAAVACSALLAGCGRSASSSSVGPREQGTLPTAAGAVQVATTSVPATPVRPPLRDSKVSQVLSGWFAAEAAFADAARTPNPNAPELAATTIDPQLSWSQSLLERMDASGEVARGPIDYGTPRVIALRGNQATVRACARDAEIVVFAESGRVVPGILGQVDYELFASTMEQTRGGWKLLTQAIGVGQCDRL